jgi:hypothetical protein
LDGEFPASIFDELQKYCKESVAILTSGHCNAQCAERNKLKTKLKNSMV